MHASIDNRTVWIGNGNSFMHNPDYGHMRWTTAAMAVSNCKGDSYVCFLLLQMSSSAWQTAIVTEGCFINLDPTQCIETYVIVLHSLLLLTHHHLLHGIALFSFQKQLHNYYFSISMLHNN